MNPEKEGRRIGNSDGAGSRGNRDRQIIRFIPALAALIAFVVYWLTLLPEVGPGDSAELAVQAYQLGVTHPPGYPVHTFLGKLFTLVCSEPAVATNLLSAVCAAVAVGLLSAIVLNLTGGWCGSLFAPLMFALTPRIWEAAVVTEVYTVNVCLLALALWLLVKWYKAPRAWLLWTSAVVLGISLGSSLANVILLPGFALLVWHRRSGGWIRLASYLLAVAVVGGLVLSWTWFRASSVIPLGVAFVPDTLPSFLRYLTGAQYSALTLYPAGFYLHRFAEHGYFFGAAFLWLGIAFGILGIGAQWKQHRVICTALAVIFIVNFGYFTGFPWTDYQQMAAPSYLVFAIWIGCGIEFGSRRVARPVVTIARVVVPLVLVGGLLFSGIRTFNERPPGTPVTDFARTSFETFPEGATVFAGWSKFTPLVYFQRVHGLRPDVTVCERAYGPRQYETGRVEDWRKYTYANAGSRPVVIDMIDRAAPPGYKYNPLGHGWYQVTASPASD